MGILCEEAVKAGEEFAKLYQSQIERLQRISASNGKDMAKRPIVIGVAGGDGIGPIITAEGERVLKVLLDDELRSGSVIIRDIEGLTIENRLALNQSVPSDVLEQIKQCDVLLKGPTTTPSGGTMTSANVSLRKALDLYANIRPVKVPSLGIDWIFFRENTEGEYTLGSNGVQLRPDMAVDFKVITGAGTERIARAAYEYARANGKTRVSIVTKSNIMKKTDGLFSAVCHEVAKDYPEIVTDEFYVDIMSAMLVNTAKRHLLQVILAPNLYGDILTDEAAQIQGGVGTAGSANTGDRYAMFEAIHGSAPRVIEEGRGAWANPESILRAVVMLLTHIGRADAAQKLENALDECREEGLEVKTGGLTCREFGNKVIEKLEHTPEDWNPLNHIRFVKPARAGQSS